MPHYPRWMAWPPILAPCFLTARVGATGWGHLAHLDGSSTPNTWLALHTWQQCDRC